MLPMQRETTGKRVRKIVTPMELKILLKSHRWTLRDGMRSGDQTVYSAAQRQGKRVVSRYIGTARRLTEMTEAEILAKLTGPSKRGLNDVAC